MAMTPLVGRAGERAALADLLRGAEDGRFGAVVLQGDAGIGKTHLVRDACEAAGEPTLVLAGSCLPLTSVTVPLLGLRSAVRALPIDERPAVLGPARARADDSSRSRGVPVPVAVDDWLTATCSGRPVVLVVEDLHWADEETLDALMYVLAGPADRRLAVVLTVRSTDVGPQNLLHRWLCDARRLPAVTEVTLGPLSRDEVDDEVALVLGAPAHTTLVDEVFARSGGNPYFARLLVGGLDPSARSLPTRLPEELSAAAVRSWSSLSLGARRLLVALAVGGRPVLGRALARVADVADLPDPGPALREAVEAGLVDIAGNGSAWFHHSLQAEALEEGLLPDERRLLHAGFATSYAREAESAGDPGAELAETVSDHFFLADQPEMARRWARRAAEVMRGTGDRQGRVRMARRVLALSAAETVERAERIALLEDLRDATAEVADWAEELEVVDTLLGILDPSHAPELARIAVLTATRWELAFVLGLGPPSADLEPSLHATEGLRGTPERRFLVAVHAEALIWEGRHEDARPLVAEAMEGSPPVVSTADAGPGVASEGPPDVDARAWSRALATASVFTADDGDTGRARTLAVHAAALASASGDPRGMVSATFAEANTSSSPNELASVLVFAGGRERAEAAGFPPRYVGWLSSTEALGWFLRGDVGRCEERLRVALGSDPGPTGDVYAREVAALLACGRGRTAEAVAHLARAEELGTRSVFHIDLARVRAVVRLETGDLEGAADAALAGDDPSREQPPWEEWRLPLAARALADLADRARGEGADPGPHLARLDAVLARAPHVIPTEYYGEPYERVVDGLDALYRAEVSRARAAEGGPEEWMRAAELLGAAGLPWDEVYACWRAAGALLHRGKGEDRRRGAEQLRRGHEMAVRLGAAPLRGAIEGVARSARISLASVAVGGSGRAGLTKREQEVMAHVVAGRTYAEIAGALFLSEKTVSSHISNMLRKTGAANRVELAAWAGRSGGSS